MERPNINPVPCGFAANQLFNPSEIEDCINVIPFDPLSKQVTSIIPTILEHLKGYAYRDTYLNPQPYHKNQTIDLVAELEAIKPSNFNNTYNFYR